MKTTSILYAHKRLRQSGAKPGQADAQLEAVGLMTDHLASREDLLATKKDLETKIARASNKTILAVFGMLGLLVAVLKLWPEASA